MILTVSHNFLKMAVVYINMYFICKICFTVYTGETKINDTYLHILLDIHTDKTSLLVALL